MHDLKVAIVIPAYNEEQRIAQVLNAVTKSKLADEIIVVSDGSTDRTAAIAAKFEGVRVIDLKQNVGKGGAMVAGVGHTDADIITFVDADLAGLRAEHVDAIIAPMLTGDLKMCIGVFRGGKFWSDASQRIAPFISGQRAVRREMIESLPYLSEMRMGVEIALHNYAKRNKMKTRRVFLRGVSNFYKEKKMGLVKGTQARAKMYREMARAVLQDRRRQTIKRRGTVRRRKKHD